MKRNEYNYDFIIGRGKIDIPGYLNLPINKYLQSRNIIFIDPDERVGADIQQNVQDVNFSQYDDNKIINIRFIFDWSCFYCTAIYGIVSIVQKLNRKCQFLIPLGIDEKTIPDIIKITLRRPFIKLDLIEGLYPLFDWESDGEKIGKFINRSAYILISGF